MASHFTQPYNPTIQNNPAYAALPQQMQQVPFYTPQLPTPAGSVYATNTIQEANNVPVGMGTTVALCLPENKMLIKTSQNGVPIIKMFAIQEIVQKTTFDLEQENQTLANENQQLKDSLLALQQKVSNIETQVKEATTPSTTGGKSEWQL